MWAECKYVDILCSWLWMWQAASCPCLAFSAIVDCNLELWANSVPSPLQLPLSGYFIRVTGNKTNAHREGIKCLLRTHRPCSQDTEQHTNMPLHNLCTSSRCKNHKPAPVLPCLPMTRCQKSPIPLKYSPQPPVPLLPIQLGLLQTIPELVPFQSTPLGHVIF